jgi:hypothetical protein
MEPAPPDWIARHEGAPFEPTALTVIVAVAKIEGYSGTPFVAVTTDDAPSVLGASPVAIAHFNTSATFYIAIAAIAVDVTAGSIPVEITSFRATLKLHAAVSTVTAITAITAVAAILMVLDTNVVAISKCAWTCDAHAGSRGQCNRSPLQFRFHLWRLLNLFPEVETALKMLLFRCRAN